MESHLLLFGPQDPEQQLQFLAAPYPARHVAMDSLRPQQPVLFNKDESPAGRLTIRAQSYPRVFQDEMEPLAQPEGNLIIVHDLLEVKPAVPDLRAPRLDYSHPFGALSPISVGEEKKKRRGYSHAEVLTGTSVRPPASVGHHNPHNIPTRYSPALQTRQSSFCIGKRTCHVGRHRPRQDEFPAPPHRMDPC